MARGYHPKPSRKTPSIIPRFFLTSKNHLSNLHVEQTPSFATPQNLFPDQDTPRRTHQSLGWSALHASLGCVRAVKELREKYGVQGSLEKVLNHAGGKPRVSTNRVCLHRHPGWPSPAPRPGLPTLPRRRIPLPERDRFRFFPEITTLFGSF